MKIVIVIPTYNESENVKILIPKLEEVFQKVPRYQCIVLFVDGNSPDGTGEIIKEFAKTNENIHLLLEKEKAGLGAAYAYGMRHAMETLNADVVMEMDADFQHNPEDVTRFIEKIEEGYDYVIGSRFVKGGSLPKQWSFKRKFFSVGGSIFSKIVLGIKDINDFTSGYKASRVKNYLDKIDLNNVRSKGFAYKIDLLYKMYKLGAKTVEIPIQFGLRDRGNSKMEGDNFMDSLKVVVSIRLSENKSFVKFLIAGFAGLFTDAVIFNILRHFFVSSDRAAIFSGLIAMIVTYTINNVWSFKDRRINGILKLISIFIVYAASSTIPIIIRSQLVLLFVNAMGESIVSANLGFGLGVIFGLVWNFTVYSKIIWKNRDSERKNSQEYA